jgi:hypothetical protein
VTKPFKIALAAFWGISILWWSVLGVLCLIQGYSSAEPEAYYAVGAMDICLAVVAIAGWVYTNRITR